MHQMNIGGEKYLSTRILNFDVASRFPLRAPYMNTAAYVQHRVYTEIIINGIIQQNDTKLIIKVTEERQGYLKVYKIYQ